MLGHPDRSDRVERPVDDLAVVLQSDLDRFGEPGLGDAPAGQFGLGRGDGHADCPTPSPRGGVQGQRAPAAADVEQPLPGPQSEFAADEVQLGLLCLIQRRRRLAEVGAAVDQRGARATAGRSRSPRRSGD